MFSAVIIKLIVYGQLGGVSKTCVVIQTKVSTFESELLVMPLDPCWLFGEGIQDVVDKVRAQKSAQNYLSANTFSFGPKKGRSVNWVLVLHSAVSNRRPKAKIKNRLEGF